MQDNQTEYDLLQEDLKTSLRLAVEMIFIFFILFHVLDLGLKLNGNMQNESIQMMYFAVVVIQVSIETVIVRCKKLSDESVVKKIPFLKIVFIKQFFIIINIFSKT